VNFFFSCRISRFSLIDAPPPPSVITAIPFSVSRSIYTVTLSCLPAGAAAAGDGEFLTIFSGLLCVEPAGRTAKICTHGASVRTRRVAWRSWRSVFFCRRHFRRCMQTMAAAQPPPGVCPTVLRTDAGKAAINRAHAYVAGARMPPTCGVAMVHGYRRCQH
jgi:hypothetical protein